MEYKLIYCTVKPESSSKGERDVPSLQTICIHHSDVSIEKKLVSGIHMKSSSMQLRNFSKLFFTLFKQNYEFIIKTKCRGSCKVELYSNCTLEILFLAQCRRDNGL